MSTEKYTINEGDGWVKFADAGEDFTCELLHLAYAEITVQESSPTVNSPFHPIRAGTLFVRPGTGDAYVRVSPDFPVNSLEIVVSK